MGFLGSVRALFANCLDYRGRASRAEFWQAIAFALAATLAATILDDAAGTDAAVPLAVLTLLLPILSLQVRRLHDIGRSGWWLGLAPAMGPVVLLLGALLGPAAAWALLTVWGIAAGLVGVTLLAWYSDAGHPEPNAYGRSPYHREPEPMYLAARFG